MVSTTTGLEQPRIVLLRNYSATPCHPLSLTSPIFLAYMSINYFHARGFHLSLCNIYHIYATTCSRSVLPGLESIDITRSRNQHFQSDKHHHSCMKEAFEQGL